MSGPAMASRSGAVEGRHIGPPPLPHEHGAWVILYAPLVITLAALAPVPITPALLLFVAVTGLFLGRNALGLILRRRGNAGTTFWLGVYLIVAAAGAVPLLLSPNRGNLLFIGGLAAALFGVHALLLLRPARKRLDRSQWGEVLAVGALTLTAPAAYAVVCGHLDAMAVCLWVSCALYFSSSIFFVKMLLGAVKVKGSFGWRERWQVGRDNVIYHLFLVIVVFGVTVVQNDRGSLLTVIAYLPIIVRAFWGWIKLSNKLPPLRRVGLGETVYALWFTAFFLLALTGK